MGTRTNLPSDALVEPDDDTTLGAGDAAVASGSQQGNPPMGREHVSGLFADSADAENALGEMEALGVPRSDISVIPRGADETAEAEGGVVVADVPAELADPARAILAERTR